MKKFLIVLVLFLFTIPFFTQAEVRRALRIGSRLNFSTYKSLLFVDANKNIAEDSNLTWDPVGRLLDLGTNLVTQGISFNGNLAISDGDDTFLRLNNNGDFTGGIYTPSVFRADSGYSVDGRAMISGDGVSHTAQNTDDNHYGYFEFRNNTGTRGAFMGWGNGGNLVSIELDNADYFNVANGDLGINQITPTSKLHVVGDTADNTDHAIKIDNTSGNILRVRNDGKIAINTGSDPQYDISFNNFHIDDSDASPNAGYIRFGDGSGWKYHWGRAQETPAGAYNTDTTGVLMTLQDNGNLGLNTLTPDVDFQNVGVLRSGEDTTNYTELESDGTIEMNGNATVWKDINVGGVSLRQGASNQPTLVNFDTTTIQVYEFSPTATNELHGNVEMQHDYKEGSDLVAHVHWYPTNTNTGDVKWDLEYTVEAQDGTVTTGTLSTTDTASGTAWQMQPVDIGTITGTNIDIEDQIHFRLARDGGDVTDDYNDGAVIATFGVHYEADTLGSRQIKTK